MINTCDIYSKINPILIENNYHNLDINGKKTLIDKALKVYIISKLESLGKLNLLKGDNANDLSVGDLLEILANEIPEDKHHSTLNHFVHLIANLAGNLQGFDILWCEEKNESLIENPIIDFNAAGLLNEIKTHKNTPYVKIFNLVYYTFMNEFMKDEPHK